MIKKMVKRLNKPMVIVSTVGLVIAGLGLIVKTNWLYLTGLIIAIPIYSLYFVPMGIVLLWVLLVAPWCPWDPPFLREDKE